MARIASCCRNADQQCVLRGGRGAVCRRAVRHARQGLPVQDAHLASSHVRAARLVALRHRRDRLLQQRHSKVGEFYREKENKCFAEMLRQFRSWQKKIELMGHFGQRLFHCKYEFELGLMSILISVLLIN
jgi:hypothetical protein